MASKSNGMTKLATQPSAVFYHNGDFHIPGDGKHILVTKRFPLKIIGISIKTTFRPGCYLVGTRFLSFQGQWIEFFQLKFHRINTAVYMIDIERMFSR